MSIGRSMDSDSLDYPLCRDKYNFITFISYTSYLPNKKAKIKAMMWLFAISASGDLGRNSSKYFTFWPFLKRDATVCQWNMGIWEWFIPREWDRHSLPYSLTVHPERGNGHFLQHCGISI